MSATIQAHEIVAGDTLVRPNSPSLLVEHVEPVSSSVMLVGRNIRQDGSLGRALYPVLGKTEPVVVMRARGKS